MFFSVSEPVAMKRVKQGSLSAVLDNGVHLSYSFYGPTGEYIGDTLKTHTNFRLCKVFELCLKGHY